MYVETFYISRFIAKAIYLKIQNDLQFEMERVRRYHLYIYMQEESYIHTSFGTGLRSMSSMQQAVLLDVHIHIQHHELVHFCKKWVINMS